MGMAGNGPANQEPAVSFLSVARRRQALGSNSEAKRFRVWVRDWLLIEGTRAHLRTTRRSSPSWQASELGCEQHEPFATVVDHVHDCGHVHGVVKMASSVNAGELTGAALEKALAQRLRELLSGVAWLKGWKVASEPVASDHGCDFKAALPLRGGKTAELWVVRKANPRPDQIAQAARKPGSQVDRMRLWWDNPTMTVIADNKKRVTLPTKPGERFDLQSFGGDKFILTRLAPVDRTGRVRLVKKHGCTLAASGRTITQEETRKLLDEFP